ncbi:MAG: choice-of-anchor B family protein [Gammaproteobacteria bacterium]|nr:choice-of-anchor B family protein [Gammaproteobacteria bacterium]MDH4255148.1 choice-of-anchor B family protein [Gammaproteobacteria bacterium]MDH5309424.1 choice-of-anchor B family protein [Gammaproteobacteria bacterium]
MDFRIPIFSTAAAIALAAGVTPALAHSDLEKPLYVASDGSDDADCLDPANPCRSLSKALTRAGKGGQVRVAQGSFVVNNPEDLFHLLSGVVDVRGGFRQADDFKSISGRTQLIGAPPEYREALGLKGFDVIVDRKGLRDDAGAVTKEMLALHQKLQKGAGAAPCQDGQIAGLGCQSIDLLSHMAFGDFSGAPSAAADVWGFVDLNSNREYAIIGLDAGTAVVDVSDPENPEQIGFVLGRMAIWRDIKVAQFFDRQADRWRAYAYVTTDGAPNGSSDGLVVIDLTGLPNSIDTTGYTSDFTAAHNVFATNTDFGTGLPLAASAQAIIVAGSNNGAGRFRAYTLDNPAAPAFASMPAGTSSDYMHDAASMIITDARKDTQCVNSGSYCEVLFDFNETTVDIWDITDISNPQRLSRTQYLNRGYVHSGWKSEDNMHLFVQDELDEQRTGLNTTLRSFSLQDLREPTQETGWTGTVAAIDHNGFVRGNRYYMSNYSRGLTVLDITDPARPTEVGNLDTYPFSDTAAFVGAWGTYPYFHSGTIAISDIDSGLYLVRDRSLDVPAGRLGFGQPSFAATEGQTVSLPVFRELGSSGAVSIDYQVLRASADDADYVTQSGVLTWADGDGAAQAIDLGIINDGVSEGMERLLVQLVNPTGGATLGNTNTASIYVSDPGQSGEIAFLDASIDKNERDRAATIIVRRLGTALGSVSIDYAVSGGSAAQGTDFDGDISGTLTWSDGDGDPRSLRLALIDDTVAESAEFLELSLTNPQGGAVIGTLSTVRINISDNDTVSSPPPQPPIPPAGGGSGGGSTAPVALLVLLAVLATRVSRRGWSARWSVRGRDRWI